MALSAKLSEACSNNAKLTGASAISLCCKLYKICVSCFRSDESYLVGSYFYRRNGRISWNWEIFRYSWRGIDSKGCRGSQVNSYLARRRTLQIRRFSLEGAKNAACCLDFLQRVSLFERHYKMWSTPTASNFRREVYVDTTDRCISQQPSRLHYWNCLRNSTRISMEVVNNLFYNS